MSFREMAERDNCSAFSNLDEFADARTVVYDDVTYEDVPVTMTQLKAKDRPVTVSDHAQGIYLVTAIAHFPRVKLDGKVPEQGARIRISDDTGFLRDYYVGLSGCSMGLVRLELEGLDE